MSAKFPSGGSKPILSHPSTIWASPRDPLFITYAQLRRINANDDVPGKARGINFSLILPWACQWSRIWLLGS